MTLILVFTGGDDVPADIVDDVPMDAAVVAADSGLALAQACGRVADVAVGDFDSIDPILLADAEKAGTVVERHAVAKDRTDLALGLDRAVAMGADEILVIGGSGGRLDHLLGNITLLAAPEYAGIRVRARSGSATMTVVWTDAAIEGARGELVSLVPMNGPAIGVSTEGLLFPLTDATLPPGTSLGISNELLGDQGRVSVAGGVLIVVQPGEQGVLVEDLTTGSAS